MICTHCGARLPENSYFCPKCGLALSPNAGMQPPEEGVRLRVARPTCSAPGYGDAVPPVEPSAAHTPSSSVDWKPQNPPSHGTDAAVPVSPRREPVGGADANPVGTEARSPADEPKASAAQPRPEAQPAAPEAVYETEDVKTFEPKKPSRARAWTAPAGAPGSGTSAAQPSSPVQKPSAPQPDVSPRPVKPAPAVHEPPSRPAEKRTAQPVRPSKAPAALKPKQPGGLSALLSSRRGRLLAAAAVGVIVLLLVLVLAVASCGAGQESSASSNGTFSESSSLPESSSTEPTVPDVLGADASDASQTLSDAGYTVVIEERYDEITENGRVIDQQPKAGEPLAAGKQVTLTVSLGPDLSETVVPWSDPTVEMAARICLGIGTGDVRVSDLDAITILVLDGGECRVNTEETAQAEETERTEGVLALDDLVYFRNLRALYLYGQNVASLEPMRGMNELQTLVLAGGTVSDLSPLGGLSSLTSVTVTDCAVHSAEPLTELPGLTVLDLSGNPLDSFASLSGLTGLKILRLNRCGVSDLMPLVGLTGLSELRLDENGLTGAEALAGMKELTALSFAGNRLSDLRSFEKLTSLTILDLRANGLETLSGLERLSSLEALDLSDNAFTSIEELSGMTRLKTLYIDHMSIKDVSPLYNCRSLTYLSALRGQTSVGSLVDPYQELRERLPDCEIVTR